MSTGVAAAFVGRAGELARLRECASALGPGSGAVVLLEGEAGAGKTRLLEELEPAAVGGALEYVQAPYAPVRDMLFALDARFPKVLEAAPDLASALRPLLDLSTNGEEPLEQRKILDAVAGALAKYSECEPLIAAIEDAHWIDRASASVIVHIARQAQHMRVLFIVTYRAADAMQREESRALIAQLARFARTALPLKPLSDAEAMVLIGEATSTELPLPVRRSICELAQGNPLFILELARHAEQDPGHFERGLPVSLQALVHDRIARFSESERDVLRVCAALETFGTELVAEIAGVEAAAIAATLRKARAEHLVDEAAGRFRFRHALIRRAIGDEVLGIARLAFHYWMAGDAEHCERYNVLAAEDAMRVQAYEAAAAFYERAIGGRDVDETTYATACNLAQAYEAAGRYRQAVDAYRSIVQFARRELPAWQSARAGIALSRACFHALDDEGSISAVRDAIADVDAVVHPALHFELTSLLAWYLVHLRRVEEARASLDRAAQIIACAEPLPLIRYHEAQAAYEVHARNGGAWREHVENALAIADTLDDASRIHRYTNAMALAIASNLDDFPFAFELFERIRPEIEAEQTADRVAGMQSTLCWMHYVSGRLNDARRTIDVLLPYMHDTAIYAYRAVSVGIPLALRTGDAQLLKSCLRPRLLDEAFGSEDPLVFGPVAAAVAEHLLVQGREGEAIALLERTLRRLTNGGNNFELLLVAGKTGSQTAAHLARNLLKPWMERSRSARAVMLLLDAHAERVSSRRAKALKAAEAFAELSWRLHQAQALELAGELESARSIYAQTGAHAEVARLSAQGTQSTKLRDVLSRREAEVAELVAEGRSNRAIAEHLSLSERTVENHIGSIFNKLNLRSRVEIAALVAGARGR